MFKRQLIARQQAMLANAQNENRAFTAEEQQEWDDIQRKLEGTDEEPNTADNTRAVEDERRRCAEITELCRDFGVDEETLRGYIENGKSTDAVRAAILEKMKEDKAPISTGITVIEDEQDKFRKAAADALIMRSGMTLDKPAEGARDLVHMSLKDLFVKSSGDYSLTQKSASDLYAMAQRQYLTPTAAFPAILDQAINKAYVEGHKKANTTFEKWTQKGTLKDFKTADNNYVSGPAGEFKLIPEGGELKHDIPQDAKKPSRKLRTYGTQFTLSREAFINDDIDMITKMPAKYAASAKKTINKQCCEILINNPAIYDGTALFSQKHGNLVKTGSGITKESLIAMMTALQSQLNEFDEAILIRPAVMLVPVGMSVDALTLFNSPTINTTDNQQAANPLYNYRNSIEVVEEPTLNALCGGFGNTMPWFLIGDSEDTDGIQVDYLNGIEIPTIRRMEVPGQLGFVWDIYLDWGISVMDYRGIVKNPGISIANPLGY